MENKGYKKPDEFVDFYTENSKPVLVLKDKFIRLSVARVVTDNERTLDKFTEACGLSDKFLLREWSKALGATDAMIDSDSYDDLVHLWQSKTDTVVVPICLHRSAPGELWILGDGDYNLLIGQENPLVAGNASCLSINLRYSKYIDFEEEEILDDGEELRLVYSSRINGVYNSDFRFGIEYVPDEVKYEVEKLFERIPWDITFVEDERKRRDKVKITYK